MDSSSAPKASTMADRSSSNRVSATAAASSSARPSSSPLRHRPLARAATVSDVTSPLAQQMPRRRSSFMTNDSFDRQSLHSSTHDLLLPRLSKAVEPDGGQHESTHLHSAPLALALLPAVGGLIFKNGSAILTDVTLLVLASIFLNWSVRLPWDWYHSAQTIRLQEEVPAEAESYFPSTDTIIEEEPDSALSDEKTSQPPTPQRATSPHASTPPRATSDEASASAELRLHEALALLACFLFPMFGAWLLHHIRSQLSRPSEGLVSDYNLSIFLLAAELRPMSHLLKMIQARTLHLQRLVASNPHVAPSSPSADTVSDLTTRLDELEAHVASRSDALAAAAATASSTTVTKEVSQQQQQQLAASVRSSMQPDLDAVTRATRRYEKRATVLGLQMESRLADIEARMRDTLALAAGAERAATERRRSGLGRLWGAFGMLLGALADVLAWLISLPLRSAELGFVALLSALGLGANGLREILGVQKAGLRQKGGKAAREREREKGLMRDERRGGGKEGRRRKE